MRCKGVDFKMINGPTGRPAAGRPAQESKNPKGQSGWRIKKPANAIQKARFQNAIQKARKRASSLLICSVGQLLFQRLAKVKHAQTWLATPGQGFGRLYISVYAIIESSIPKKGAPMLYRRRAKDRACY